MRRTKGMIGGMDTLERIYGAATRRLPPRTAGKIDRYRPSFAASWGGPMNGQTERRRIVRDIARTIDFGRVLETGTYRGTTTEFLAALFDADIATVEANPRFFTYAATRLAVYPNIRCTQGDSRHFLRTVAKIRPSAESVFIYLDAHWEEDLPLAEELEIIAARFKRTVVMVDDFEVPDDPGYAFDDYGPGKALTAAYLPDVVAGWGLFYPSAPSIRETGARRGCCVLASPEMDLSGVASLRPA